MALRVFEGLIHSDVMHLYLGILRIRGMVMASVQTKESIKKVQKLTLEWLQLVDWMSACGEHPDLNLQRPNTHLLQELVFRSLPIMGNANFFRGGNFESHHKHNKQIMKRITALHGNAPETYAMKECAWQGTLRMMFRGGHWGDNASLRVGDALIDMKDARPGKEHLPHPLLRMIGADHPSMPDRSVDQKWIVGTYLWTETKKRATHPPSDMEELKSSFAIYYSAFPIDFDEEDSVQYHWLRSIQEVGTTHRVRVGDHVSVKYDNKQYIIQVQHLLEVITQGNSFLFVYPLWYMPKAQPLNEHLPPIITRWDNRHAQVFLFALFFVLFVFYFLFGLSIC